MNIAIVEDESLAAERLEDMILELEPDARIMVKLESVAESVRWLRNHQPDLLFLDIQLSDGTSFAIFEQLDLDVPVIFTTAYDSYAIKAFTLNSVHYLLKPIRKEDLRASLEKYKHLRQPGQPNLQQLVQALQDQKPEYKKRFMIQYGERIKKVESEDIAFFYAMEKSVFLTTFDKQSYTVDYSLDKLQDVLDPELFFRINRQMLIHYHAIHTMFAFSRARIKIELNPPPPKSVNTVVSVERASGFKQWIDK